MEERTAEEKIKIEYDERNLLGETVTIRLDENFTGLRWPDLRQKLP